MKNFFNGIIITILLAFSIFIVTQFKTLSLQATENIVPSIKPTPTIIPTPTPIIFSGIQKFFIYLYPSKFIPMSIKLSSTLSLQESLPLYPKNGWYVIATSKSLIENKYDYLSFETKIDNLLLPDSAWIVSKTNIKNWFDENLPKFGLNQKEISQFKTYCLSQINSSAFYRINYQIPQNKLLVSPTPNTILRYQFYFTNLNSAPVLPTPTITAPNRSASSVVELSAAFKN